MTNIQEQPLALGLVMEGAVIKGSVQLKKSATISKPILIASRQIRPVARLTYFRVSRQKNIGIVLPAQHKR